jgi:hypothetical protein
VIVLFVSGTVFSGKSQTASPFLYFTKEQIFDLKTSIRNNDTYVMPDIETLRQVVEYWISKGPWSVTYYATKAANGDPHDYYSESPYWWPDPDDPEAAYIRKDGLRNPDRFMEQKKALLDMYGAVTALSMAGYFFDNDSYAERAVELISIWFLDEDTHMNPHLKYAQAIPNKSPGRGVGIIDTHRFVKLIEAINLLKMTNRLTEDQNRKLMVWFSDYLYWLTHSKNGLKEKFQGNNHSSWWGVQVASYAWFSENYNVMDFIWTYYREYLVPGQIAADGNFPEEDIRTLTLGYSFFNLDAHSVICRMAYLRGAELWNFRTSKGIGIKNSLDYLFPFFVKPDNWTKQQIKPVVRAGRIFPVFVGLSLNNRDYLELYSEINKTYAEDREIGMIDPFILLVNLMTRFYLAENRVSN